jgi:HAD superfamily hydrolase (TIGR01509 family)
MPPDTARRDVATSPSDDSALAAVQVVLCDADGNLFPSEEPAFVASTEVTNRFLREYGSDRVYAAEELRLATTGLNFRTTIVALARANGVAVASELASPDRSDAGRTRAAASDRPILDASALEQWVETEKRAVSAYLRSALRPDPEVLRPLTAIADSYELAAVSSSADERLAACFEVTGLAHFFPPERRFSAEDSLAVPTSKPDPAIYLHAAAQLGISTAQALAVEDSVPGATSAVGAGCLTVGNLQFVPVDERAERRKAFDAIGVWKIVESWDDVAALVIGARRTQR